MFHENEFLDYLQAEGVTSPVTLRHYRALLGYVRSHCSDRDIDDVSEVGESDLEALLESIRSLGLSPETVHHRFCALRRYFAWLRDRRLIFASSMERMKFPRFPRRHHPALAPDRMPEFLERIRTDSPVHLRSRAMIELAYSSALRIGEIVRLRISDVDRSAGTVFIEQSKGKADRLVPVGSVALGWLSRYGDEIRPLHSQGNCDTVFITSTGKALTPDYARETIQKTLAASRLPRIRPHSIRATAATALLEGGMGLPYIARLLGHTDISSTRIYLRVEEKELKDRLTEAHPRFRMTTKNTE